MIAASIGAILTTIFSLLNGIFYVFPLHFILPIILVVYFYPERGVLFSLGLGLMYISLIYLFRKFGSGPDRNCHGVVCNLYYDWHCCIVLRAEAA